MAFKLIESAQRRRQMVNTPHLVALVRAGATFVNGKLVERPGDQSPSPAEPAPPTSDKDVAEAASDLDPQGLTIAWLARAFDWSGVGKAAPMTGQPDSSASASFERDVRPMFREKDHDSMSGHIDLWSYSDVKAHQDAILERLRNGTMPCDGAWPQERVAVFQGWIAGGSQP
jgi:hypothetical protein